MGDQFLDMIRDKLAKKGVGPPPPEGGPPKTPLPKPPKPPEPVFPQQFLDLFLAKPGKLPFDISKASGQSFSPLAGAFQPVSPGQKPQLVFFGPTNQTFLVTNPETGEGISLTSDELKTLLAGGPEPGPLPKAVESLLPKLFGADTLAGQQPNLDDILARLAPLVLGKIPGIELPADVVGPKVTPAQFNIAPEGFERFQEALLESEFAPIERQLTREEERAKRALEGDLGRRGLASSVAGIAALREQGEEFARRRLAAIEDASNRATVQRFGLEFAQGQDNARRRQEANLASAGFDAQARLANADNFLRGGIAGTQAALTEQGLSLEAQRENNRNFLASLGLTLEQGNNIRNDFLRLLGVQEADLARMDQFQLQSTSIIFDIFLRELAILTGAGQFASSRSEAEKSSGFLDNFLGSLASNLIGVASRIGGGIIGGSLAGPLGAAAGGGLTSVGK